MTKSRGRYSWMILLKNPKNASTRLSMNGKSPMISTTPPFVLRLSKDEQRVFQQNHGSNHIEQFRGPATAEQYAEIVERKGLDHPDTICDLVREQISLALHRGYAGRRGRILHYNCDKGMLVAGQAERRYGGGRVIEPMRLVIGDRATLVKEFDVAEVTRSKKVGLPWANTITS